MEVSSIIALGAQYLDRAIECNAKTAELLASYKASTDKPLATLIDALEQAEDVVSSIAMIVGHCATFNMVKQMGQEDLDREKAEAAQKLAEAEAAAAAAHAAADTASAAVGKETSEAVVASQASLEALAKAAAADAEVARLRALIAPKARPEEPRAMP